MNLIRVRASVRLIALIATSVAVQVMAVRAIAQDLPKVYDASVPRERQIALAESAAPAEVSGKATLYILGPKGDEKIREGSNGFSCYVGRHFVKPTETTVEPACFDAEGSATVLAVYLREEELRSSGKSEEAIKTETAKGYQEGRFKYPSKPGFLYMMSTENRLGPTPDHGTAGFPPHLMFYAPNLTTKDIGFDSQPQLDYLGMTHPGAPDNLIVVLPKTSEPASGSSR